MHARARNVKTGLIAAAVAILLLVGAGVAYATGSNGDSSAQPAGSNIEKAKSIALDQTNGGRVTGTEVGDEEGYYEVEVIREDSSRLAVHLDRNFNVVSTPAITRVQLVRKEIQTMRVTVIGAGNMGRGIGHRLVAGGHDVTKETVAQLVRDGSLRAIDVGPLERARHLEGLGFLGITLQQPLCLNF